MAEFVTVQESQPGSFTGRSAGIQASPNTAISGLFEGLSTALAGGVTAVDEGIKSNIEKDIFDAVDDVQAEFGVPEATDLQADPDEVSGRTMPTGVQRANQQLETLQSAYVAGNLKESHYWARMNNMVRQLRGKYPGYRAEIDQMVAGVTGQRPANALRNALFSEWGRSQSEGLSEKDKFVNQNLEYLPPDYFDAPEKYSYDQLRAFVSKKQRTRVELDARKSELDYLAKQDQATDKVIEDSLNADMTQIVYSTLLDVEAGLGRNFSEVSQTIDRFQQMQASGSTATGQELEQLKAMASGLDQEFNTLLYQHWASNPHYSKMSEEAVRTATQKALMPVRMLQQAIADENFGLAKSVAASIEVMNSDTQRQLLRDIPQLQRLSALNDLVGPTVTQLAMTLDKKGTSVLTEVLSNSAEAGHLLGGETMRQSFDVGIDKNAGADYFMVLADWGRLLDGVASGDIPQSIFLNKINAMFSRDNDAIMNDPKYFANDESKFNYFKTVASPQISQKMIGLKNQGFTEEYNIYSRWVARNFVTLFQSQLSGLTDLSSDPNDSYDVKWNEQTGRFSVDWRIAGPWTVRSPVRSSLNDLNESIQLMRPIFAAEGVDTNEQLMGLFQEAGYDQNPDRRWTFVVEMGIALANSLGVGSDGQASE